MTIDEIEFLCREYDAEVGEYPEHELEGATVFAYLKARAEGTPKQEAYRRVVGGIEAPDDWPRKADKWRK